MKIILGVAILAVFSATAMQAQSLADLAKKTQDAKDKAKQDQGKGDSAPPKVYTNADLTDKPSSSCGCPTR